MGDTVGDESGRDWWFTWAATGMAEAERGETVGSSLEAEQSAMHHFFANATIDR